MDRLLFTMHKKRPEYIPDVFHKRYNRSNDFLNFAKFFSDDKFNFFKFSNYQALIQAYTNTPIKINRNFQRF